MSKSAKIWLIVATSLLIIGCLIFGGVMTVLKWDFSKLSTNKYEIKKYEVGESFNSISINVDTADVKILPSEGMDCSVECHEQKNIKYSVEVIDNVLTVKVVDSRRWYEHIGINFGSPKLTVYLPRGEYGKLYVRSSTGDVEISKDFTFEAVDVATSTGDVKNFAFSSGDVTVKASTGDILVEGISAKSIDLSVSTGDITLSNVNCSGDVSVKVSTGRTKLTNLTCQNLISGGDTGDMSLKSVIASGEISIKRSTGDVNFEASDAASIFVETDTGDVKGSLLSEKIFIINTDTGKKEVPESTTGGRCKITTDTGDIKITIN